MTATHQISDCASDRVVLENVDVAKTPWRRFWGLMFRSRTHAKTLWIEPCRSVHSMWMRFVIDVYFIDQAGCILGVKTLRPWRIAFAPKNTVRVLEVPFGLTTLEVGACVRLDEIA